MPKKIGVKTSNKLLIISELFLKLGQNVAQMWDLEFACAKIKNWVIVKVIQDYTKNILLNSTAEKEIFYGNSKHR